MRPFCDSTPILGDAAALRARMDEDGYLFIRGLVEPERIRQQQREHLAVAARHGWLDASAPVADSVANREAACVDPEPRYLEALREIYPREDLHALAHHPAVIDLFERLLGGAILVHPRMITRNVFPQRPDFTTPSHQDFPHIQGTAETYSVWIPLGDCPIERGGLEIAEGSHHDGVMPFRVTSGAGGMEVIDPFEGRWVASDFEAGDAVIFHSLTVHRALPNTSKYLRQSIDNRYQRADAPLVEASLRPYADLMSWDDVYRDWASSEYQFHWRRHDLKIVPFDTRWYDERDEQAFRMAEEGDASARATLLRIVQRDADPAKRERADRLLRRLSGAAAA